MKKLKAHFDFENVSVPTCGSRQSDRPAPLVAALCGQTDAVAHPRSQPGQDVAGGRSRDLLLLLLAVPGQVHHLIGAELGPRFLPLQPEGGLGGLGYLQIPRRVDI